MCVNDPSPQEGDVVEMIDVRSSRIVTLTRGSECECDRMGE